VDGGDWTKVTPFAGFPWTALAFFAVSGKIRGFAAVLLRRDS
jgi:apolipoprotein N-acyltransferase